MNRTGFRKLLGLAAGIALLALTGVAQAQLNTCNANIELNYVAGPPIATPGDTVRVQVNLGAGTINGGTTFTINRFRFELDCNNPPGAGSIPCTDDGAIIAYVNDNTITTTCTAGGNPVTWSTNGAGTTPNEVIFTPSAAIAIPASTPAFCNIEFDVTVAAISYDSTPNLAE